MQDSDAELQLAVAELAFWLDFAKWWRCRYYRSEDPRILELLENAETRYAAAEASCQKLTPNGNEGRERKQVPRETT